MITVYEEIRSLIMQGYSNKQIQDKLLTVTFNQINYQRRKLRKNK